MVRAIVDRTAQGDFSRWLDDVTDDFVFVTSPEIPDRVPTRGRPRSGSRRGSSPSPGTRSKPATSPMRATKCSTKSSNGAVRATARSRWRADGGS